MKKRPDIRIVMVPVDSATHTGLLHMYVGLTEARLMLQVVARGRYEKEAFHIVNAPFEIRGNNMASRLMQAEAKLAGAISSFDDPQYARRGTGVFEFPPNVVTGKMTPASHAQTVNIRNTMFGQQIEMDGGTFIPDNVEQMTDRAKAVDLLEDLRSDLESGDDARIEQAKERMDILVDEFDGSETGEEVVQKLIGHVRGGPSRTHERVPHINNSDSGTPPATEIPPLQQRRTKVIADTIDTDFDRQIALRTELFSMFDRYTPDQILEIIPNMNMETLRTKYGGALMDEFITKLNENAKTGKTKTKDSK